MFRVNTTAARYDPVSQLEVIPLWQGQPIP